jgi:hypothetical protein
MAYDGERRPDPLTWLVFVATADDGSAELYEDEGEGYAYERGVFARTRVRCSTTTDIELRFEAVEGSFASASETVEVELRGVRRPTQILIDDSATQTWDYADGRVTVRLPHGREARRLVVRAAVA